MSNIQSLKWKSGVKWFCLSTLTKSFFKSHNIIFNTNLGRLNHWKEIKLCILHFDETGQENCKQTRLRTKQPKQEKSLQLQYFMFDNVKYELGKQFIDVRRFEFLSRLLSGETLCKLLQIFPPKVLVYIWTSIPWHLFDYLMAIHLTN